MVRVLSRMFALILPIKVLLYLISNVCFCRRWGALLSDLGILLISVILWDKALLVYVGWLKLVHWILLVPRVFRVPRRNSGLVLSKSHVLFEPLESLSSWAKLRILKVGLEHIRRSRIILFDLLSKIGKNSLVALVILFKGLFGNRRRYIFNPFTSLRVQVEPQGSYILRFFSLWISIFPGVLAVGPAASMGIVQVLVRSLILVLKNWGNLDR